NGKIDSDLMAIFETICDRLFGEIDANANLVDCDDIDSSPEGVFRKPENPDRNAVSLRHLSMAGKSDINVVWHLSGQLVMCKCRNETNHSLWHAQSYCYP